MLRLKNQLNEDYKEVSNLVKRTFRYQHWSSGVVEHWSTGVVEQCSGTSCLSSSLTRERVSLKACKELNYSM